ncbi:glycosyltransferase family 2 protein [Phaeobacter sp. J2-8]|uniref:glycosyltransferase family 2 protein n=1 Tax=Phaeobacter sp. J2-8 TaxID=2931394 RepID=UPI001FD07DD4|nr:glycosyltransferase family 2 protein [Phaeobacter sp. J2-8]MCJ7872393.1 glycosyltransferase family 2 protein [Phaeobacter sp. J2-8]
MKISLHIGPDLWASSRIQQVLNDKRRQLQGRGVLFARSPGAKNHTRLFMAASDPDRVDALRFNRGYGAPDQQAALRKEVALALQKEVSAQSVEHLILSAHQFGTSLLRQSEVERLRAMLAPISDQISVIAHVECPARMLLRHYAAQIGDGRLRPLALELQQAARPDWWASALTTAPESTPEAGIFPETQMAPPWLDYRGLRAHWEGVFGAGSFEFRPLDVAAFADAGVVDEIRACFDIDDQIGKAETIPLPQAPSAEWLARARQFNDVLTRLLARKDHVVPRQLWKKLLGELRVPGAPSAVHQPGSLAAIAQRFADDLQLLARDRVDLAAVFAPDPPLPAWQEVATSRGYRATQYLLTAMPRIERATTEARAATSKSANGNIPGHIPGHIPGLSEQAARIMPDLAKEKFIHLQGSPFAPHNRLGRSDEGLAAAAYTPVPPRVLPPGSSGNVIVGCMKNEGPYILEWVAYHRAIGVDNFLIYTNDCTDGTDEILTRLQDLGILQHRKNNDWSGKSPQQSALNQSLKEPVIENADWIIHIDVDEFINVRCGNGTLQDFLDRVPDATNIAMTWRMFGHDGVARLDDRFVIEQFESCAPKYCPKPHTAWGFKTMVRNIGAYQKLSCHRPNKLIPEKAEGVHWVNGSGQPMGDEVKKNGWRNSKRTIGYDLLQLNHYALRSAESYLIKRQRGRALHVDRSIGLNYWIRMDWNDARDITIKRNVPRLRAEYDRLLADPVLGQQHRAALDWHLAKAAELHANPEFEDLYQQAIKLKLNEVERAAYALALDMET